MKDFNILNLTDEKRMSSREIAKLCNKPHDNLLKLIRSLISEGILKNTTPREYKHEQNRQVYTEYYSNKRDSLIIVARLSPEFTAKVIDRWQELEQQNQYKGRTLPKSWSETLEMLALEVKENEKLQNQLEEAQPQIAFANSVKASKDCILVGQLAVLLKQSGLDIGEKRLFKWLRTNNYLCKDKSRWNKPTQKSMDLDLFKYEETSINRSNGIILLNFTPKVTGKGQEYFINKLLANQNLLTNEDNNIHILQSEVQC